MKLSYFYKDEIFWIQNFLSKDQYKLLHSIIIKNRNLIDEKTKVVWEQKNNSNSKYDFNIEVIKIYETLWRIFNKN